METLREIKALDDAVKNQIQTIDAFARTNRSNIALVEASLVGGVRGHDAKLRATLHSVDDGLTRARGELERAADALRRVQAI